MVEVVTGQEVFAPEAGLNDAHMGRELGRLEGDADWDMPEGVALMKAAIANQG